MQVRIILIAILLCTAPEAIAEVNHEGYTALLKKYVLHGQVNYDGLKKEQAKLNSYLGSLETISKKEFDSWDESKRVAFYINAYNAYTLETILENYPDIRNGLFKSKKELKSIKEIPNAWSEKKHALFGSKWSLDQIEHDELRKKYSYPLIHFALVCAAKSCPYLRNEAYIGSKLDMQLKDQARTFFSLPGNINWDKKASTLHVSSILKWFGSDFIPKYSILLTTNKLSKRDRAIINLVKIYSPDQSIKNGVLKAKSVKFIEYDWSLNKYE